MLSVECFQAFLAESFLIEQSGQFPFLPAIVPE